MYSDADAAALYDLLNPWDGERFPSDAFYTELVMKAGDVLDVGCGSGLMLHDARGRGHTGRLVGIDPDPAALERARRRTDVEWVEGKAADARWNGEFDLATMVSHAFQCLVTDAELRSSLEAIRRALRPGAAFAFETRHPRARAWEQWATNAFDVDTAVRKLRVTYEIEDVTGDVVTFAEHTSDDGGVLRTVRSRLRFLDVAPLNAFLTEAGFDVAEQYGDWQRGPLTHASKEIVTIARTRP